MLEINSLTPDFFDMLEKVKQKYKLSMKHLSYNRDGCTITIKALGRSITACSSLCLDKDGDIETIKAKSQVGHMEISIPAWYWGASYDVTDTEREMQGCAELCNLLYGYACWRATLKNDTLAAKLLEYYTELGYIADVERKGDIIVVNVSSLLLWSEESIKEYTHYWSHYVNDDGKIVHRLDEYPFAHEFICDKPKIEDMESSFKALIKSSMLQEVDELIKRKKKSPQSLDPKIWAGSFLVRPQLKVS